MRSRQYLGSTPFRGNERVLEMRTLLFVGGAVDRTRREMPCFTMSLLLLAIETEEDEVVDDAAATDEYFEEEEEEEEEEDDAPPVESLLIKWRIHPTDASSSGESSHQGSTCPTLGFFGFTLLSEVVRSITTA